MPIATETIGPNDSTRDARRASFRMLYGSNPTFLFSNPHRILSATTPEAALEALAQAHDAHAKGAWIAGFLAYELGAALAHLPHHPPHTPYLTLGIFDAPANVTLASQAPAKLSPRIARVDYATYAGHIASIQKAIADGDFYQINLTVPFDARYDGDPLDLYADLCSAARAECTSYFEDDEFAILSLSPELFLRFEDGTIRCQPMKGTAPLDAPQRLCNEKNRAEHLMIVDLVRNDFHRIASDVHVANPFAQTPYPTFLTMTSDVIGSYDARMPFAKILNATFPCGSITGAPKEAAIKAIFALEAQARGPYCGALGYLDPHGNGEWNVAIRTLQLDTRRKAARFDVGGGIVADSRAQDEWDEIIIKSRFLDAVTEPLTIWETFAADAERDEHCARMAATAQDLGFPQTFTTITRYVATIPTREHTLVRLRAHRDGSFTHTLDALSPSPPEVKIMLAEEHVESSDPYLRWKTSWRPAHTRAFAFATQRQCFDALLCNERGEITEGTRTTFFMERDGRLHTPPIECGLLPGILRERLLASGAAVETRITHADLETAQALYIGNAARGLMRAKIAK